MLLSIPVWVVLSSLLPGLLIFFLPEERHVARTTLNLGAAVAKLVLTGALVWGAFRGEAHETRLPFLPGIELVLRADGLSLMFVSLSALLWLATTIYAVGYLEGTPNRSRFFGFFSLCVSSTMGIALAGNLFTFFVFYELLTLSTWPLVTHKGTEEAMRAGDVYLRYTVAGGAVLLAGVAWLYALQGPIDFTEGGALTAATREHRATVIVIFALLIGGLGVKACLVPLHGWLPAAMVAPAPVSALLHAVAVVKAGAFGIVRVVYDVYGVRFAHELGVTPPLVFVAAFTVLYGSVRALQQDDLKLRLAYSTVSQVAYIVLGVSVFGPTATAAGLAHIIHQGLMKVTLFFCAGNVATELGITRISDLRGVGRRLPLTMGAFTIGALGMIGMPPFAGFVTKWVLCVGAMEAGQPWVVGVLLASSLLNAAYFLPIVYDVWFVDRSEPWPGGGRLEVSPMLLVPPLATAALSVVVGLGAGFALSPLGWAERIAALEFGH